MTKQTETSPVERRDVYQILTDRAIDMLEHGTVPWHTSWAESGTPQNLIFRIPYRGISTLLLGALGYDQNFFLTMKQINALQAGVRKGEKAYPLAYWSWQGIEDENHQVQRIYTLKYVPVFNIAQCMNIPKGVAPRDQLLEHDVLPECEVVLFDMVDCPAIVNKEKEPFYHKEEDFINIQPIEKFPDADSYYTVLFNLLVHATGHPSRLNRKELMEPEELSIEEFSAEHLIAEIGGCFLRAHVGIIREITATDTYRAAWITKLKSDKTLFFKSASQAQKAVDYILDAASNEQAELLHEMVEMF